MSDKQLQGIDDIAEALAASTWHMDVLRTVKELNLPDWIIGAGFVRNFVWDCIHGYNHFTPLSDVDVIYFDAADLRRSRDQDYQIQLSAMRSGVPWSVRNQARMHARNGDQPYLSSEDAMAHWLETPTCVGATLSGDGVLSVVAPYGVQDLLNLEVCPTPSGFRKPETYRNRMEIKDWPKSWSHVRIFYPD